MSHSYKTKNLIKVLIVLSTVGSTSYFVPSAPILAQEPAPFMAIIGDGYVEGQRLMDPASLRAFYQKREGEAFWTKRTGLTGEGEELLEFLQESWKHGLNPATYHVSELARLEDEDEEGRASLELLAMDGFVRYIHDMSGMRVRATDLGMDPAHWLQPFSAKSTLTRLEIDDHAIAMLEGVQPKGGTYKKLQQELLRLSKEEPPAYEAVLPIRMSGQVKPGARTLEIAKVRARLGLAALAYHLDYYDDSTAGAVIRFQREHGINPDGIIGAKTLQFLNQTQRDRMLQLVANLERLRWAPEQKPERFIVVNIPSATLWALDQGKVVLDMPVIVGSVKRETRSFIADVTGVRFNPDWTVPPTIKSEDILPKVIEDPTYLLDKGIELVQGTGADARTIDPESVDWEDLTPADLHSIKMRQIAGSNNPLGRIRVLMPNRFDMYLHDTNHRDYFNQPDRMISSGCIRMKDPEGVASFIMEREEGWDHAKMDNLLALGKTKDVMIKNRFPVYVFYYTAWVGDDGRVVFGDDPYGQDVKLIRMLSAIDGISVAEQNNNGSPTSNSFPSFASAD